MVRFLKYLALAGIGMVILKAMEKARNAVDKKVASLLDEEKS